MVIRYCDCFASGVLCTDCDCVDCHNNSDNCDARDAAVVNVLGRNPNAFNEKLFSSINDKQVCSSNLSLCETEERRVYIRKYLP